MSQQAVLENTVTQDDGSRKKNEVNTITDKDEAIAQIGDMAKQDGQLRIITIGSKQCPPCNMFAAPFAQVAGDREEEFIALKPKTFDDAAPVLEKFNETFGTSARGYPSTFLVKDGKAIQIAASALSAPALDVLITSASEGTEKAREKISALLNSGQANDRKDVINVSEVEHALKQSWEQGSMAGALSYVTQGVIGKNESTGIFGDLNQDGKFDDLDIRQFINANTTLEQREAVDPGQSGVTVYSSDYISPEEVGLLSTALVNAPAAQAEKKDKGR